MTERYYDGESFVGFEEYGEHRVLTWRIGGKSTTDQVKRDTGQLDDILNDDGRDEKSIDLFIDLEGVTGTELGNLNTAKSSVDVLKSPAIRRVYVMSGSNGVIKFLSNMVAQLVAGDRYIKVKDKGDLAGTLDRLNFTDRS
jgi:hypothetical protein